VPRSCGWDDRPAPARYDAPRSWKLEAGSWKRRALSLLLGLAACGPRTAPVTPAPEPPPPRDAGADAAPPLAAVRAPLLTRVEPPAGPGAAASYPVVAARVFAVGDSQLRHLYGKRTFAQSPFADRYQGIEVAIRPAALDDGGDLLLAAFLEEHRRHHPRATLVYMGDAADLSCTQEMDRFVRVMAENAAIPFLMVTSNHDGFFAGNFTSKADGGGKLAWTDMPADWRRACAEPGSTADHLLTKGRAVLRIAELLPPAPPWATSLSALEPELPSGYRGAHLTYVRPLGGGDAGAPPAWGVFLDTVDYRDFDLTAAHGAGTVGSISAEALRTLDLAMFDVATAASGPRPRWIAFGHHPVSQLEPAARARLLRFFDVHPEIAGYVSAHTHYSDERSHRLPSGRSLPELVVGSTTDFGGGAPQSARLVELRVGGDRAGLASWRLVLDVDALCAGIEPLPPNDALGYVSYRLARDDTGDVPTSTWDLFWAWLEDDDLGHYRIAQTAGALLVENRLVRALAYLYRAAPWGPDELDDGARAELDALIARVSGPGIGWGAAVDRNLEALGEYERWWDPVLAPYIPLFARTLLSFGAERYLFEKLRAARPRGPARRRWFTCHAARAAEAEARRPRPKDVIFIP
jgi:hypothetical protein